MLVAFVQRCYWCLGPAGCWACSTLVEIFLIVLRGQNFQINALFVFSCFRRDWNGFEACSQEQVGMHYSLQQAHLQCHQSQQERGCVCRRLPPHTDLHRAESKPTATALQHPIHHPFLQPQQTHDWRGWLLFHQSGEEISTTRAFMWLIGVCL